MPGVWQRVRHESAQAEYVQPYGVLGKVRWVVERGLAWLHAFKRLRTRYERRADIHLGLLQLACALICHRRLKSHYETSS